MPEYQRQTETGRRARHWGAGAALGGLAIAFVSYLGLLAESNGEYSACDIPKPAAACKEIRGDEAMLSRVFKIGLAAAAVGGIASSGADALDRRLLVRQLGQRINILTKPDDEEYLDDAYMELMPEPPPNPDDSRKWT